MVRRHLARSRRHASELIAAGAVQLRGTPAAKAATQVDQDAPISVKAADSGNAAYASRGAHKLAGALTELEHRGRPVGIGGRVCLDAGASTGGFTDVLLRGGAALVHAVDVGYGQLAWRLRQDPRVRVHDRTNVRHITPACIEPPPELLVADLSFISLRHVIPALARIAAPGARFLLMVKPQFEVGRDRLPSGGVVTSPADRASAVVAVAQAATAAGLAVHDAVRSPLPGPSGNVEFFLDLQAPGPKLAREAAGSDVSANSGLTLAGVEAAAWREATGGAAAARRDAAAARCDAAAGGSGGGADGVAGGAGLGLDAQRAWGVRA
jgi:23S rRNA (cytidine1920-2'-O)/16S rRNA (cytidine1409-2'-O)-methyltransferase